jgi:hypothetical protein
MYKLNKVRGFAALPLIIGGAIIAAGLIGGAVYELNKNNLAVGKNQMLADVSSVTTSSTRPSITVISPNGGENYHLGSETEIGWKDQGVEKVEIFLEDVSGAQYLVGGPFYYYDSNGNQISGGSGGLERSVSLRINLEENPFLVDKGKYKAVAVATLNDGKNTAYTNYTNLDPEQIIAIDKSDGYFTVDFSKSSIQVVSPTKTSIWKVGETATIDYKWDNLDIGDTIQFSLIWADKVNDVTINEAYNRIIATTTITTISGQNELKYNIPSTDIYFNGLYQIRAEVLKKEASGILIGTSAGIFSDTFKLSSPMDPPTSPLTKAEAEAIAEPAYERYPTVESINQAIASRNKVISDLCGVSGVDLMCTNIRDQIKWLQDSRIKLENGVLNGISQGELKNFSYTWNKNLFYSMINDNDISALQKALTLDGVYSGPLTGNFFTLTRKAVMEFQTKHGIPSTGNVGPLTRSALNKLYSK